MSLYWKYFKVHFKSDLQYKLSFIMAFISQFFIFFSYYFTILCLFDNFSSIKGFTLYEVLLTFGIIQFGFSFCESFFRGIDLFDDLIVSGSFDRLLLRPRGILHQVFCEKISFIKFSRLLQAIIVLIIAVVKVNVDWDIYKTITLLLMICSSVILFLSIFILTASYCFYTVKGLEVRNVLTDGCKHMAQYPIGIFKKGFLGFFTFVIPFGFVNYYPLLFILGRVDNLWYMVSPLVTLFYLIPAILVFYKGAKRYSSVGS
ncbi:MAG: ABC-2 family transporter protein [Bacilli bacterium]|nr:ABC-2 family transporter protein [Bacilli bacterium]